MIEIDTQVKATTGGVCEMRTEQHATNLWQIGIKRRKKEIRFMKIMSGLMCFFLALILLFQDNMNRYQMEMNYHSFGEWLIREPIPDRGKGLCGDNPYLKTCGEIWTGGTIYKTEGENEPKDLEIDATDDSRISERSIGMLDAEIIKNGNLKLYEGRFPEKSDEIIMELNALQALGYNYDLGQKISFYLPETEAALDTATGDEKILLHQVTFTLVGTLKAYTSAWNGGDALPGAIVQKDVYDALNMDKTGYRFYQIKGKYIDADVSTFALKLMNSLTESINNQVSSNGNDLYDLGYEVNDYAYDNPFWSNKTMYRNMTIILIVLGSAIMAYLMSVYLSKRKKYYLKLREIGATLGQVLQMSAYECIGSMGPAILTGLIIAYSVSLLAVWLVSINASISFFYIFQWKTLLEILLSVAIVFSISFGCSWIILHSSRITENRKKLSRLSVWLLRKRAHKHKRLTIKEWEKRFRICQPVSVVLVRLIGIGVCVCVLACLMQIYDRTVTYHYICENSKDFTINKKETVSFEADLPLLSPYQYPDGQKEDTFYVSSGDEIQSMQQMIPGKMLQSIREMKGVQSLEGITIDQSHIFDWKDKKQSKYYQDHMNPGSAISDGEEIKDVVFDRSIHSEQEKSNNILIDTSSELGSAYWDFQDSLMYEGRYYQNTKWIWEQLKRHRVDTKVDYKDFCDGTDIILLEHTKEMVFVESDDVESDDAEERTFAEMEIETDPTIQEGDELIIHTKGQDVTVTVGAILSLDDDVIYSLGHSPYSIVGSEALGRKIAKEDGITYGYNHLEINFNGFSSSEATDKIITRQCTTNDLEYESSAEERREAFQRIFQSVLVYGGLAGIIVILYLFILSCILLEEYRRKRKRQTALLQLGVMPHQTSGRTLGNGIRESLYLLWSIPFLYLIQLLKIKADWNADAANGETVLAITSLFFNKVISNVTEKQYLFYTLIDDINFNWVIIFILIMGIAVITLHLVTGSMVGKENVTKDGNGGERHE